MAYFPLTRWTRLFGKNLLLFLPPSPHSSFLPLCGKMFSVLISKSKAFLYLLLILQSTEYCSNHNLYSSCHHSPLTFSFIKYFLSTYSALWDFGRLWDINVFCPHSAYCLWGNTNDIYYNKQHLLKGKKRVKIRVWKWNTE